LVKRGNFPRNLKKTGSKEKKKSQGKKFRRGGEKTKQKIDETSVKKKGLPNGARGTTRWRRWEKKKREGGENKRNVGLRHAKNKSIVVKGLGEQSNLWWKEMGGTDG